MFAAPEFIVAERIELLDQIEVATKLQHRMLPDRVMRGEEGSEFQTRHCFSPDCYCRWVLDPKLRVGKGQGNRGKPLPMHGCRAEHALLYFDAF